jgi:hypothetical protein
LQSKPTWLNSFEVFDHVGFFKEYNMIVEIVGVVVFGMVAGFVASKLVELGGSDRHVVLQPVQRKRRDF